MDLTNAFLQFLPKESSILRGQCRCSDYGSLLGVSRRPQLFWEAFQEIQPAQAQEFVVKIRWGARAIIGAAAGELGVEVV